MCVWFEEMVLIVSRVVCGWSSCRGGAQEVYIVEYDGERVDGILFVLCLWVSRAELHLGSWSALLIPYIGVLSEKMCSGFGEGRGVGGALVR